MKKKNGISFQLLRIVLISFVASFLLLTFFHSMQYEKNTANLVVQSNEHSVKQLNESFDTFYQQLVYITVQLSSNSDLKAYLKDTPEDNFEYYRMQRYVNDYLQSFTGFFHYSDVNIILYGSNNCTYSTYNETIHLEETGILEEDFMKKAAGDYKSMGIDFYHRGITPYTEENHYTFAAYSMFDPNQQSTYGYIVMVIDESAFSQLFSDLKHTNNRFSVVSQEGMILSDSRKNKIGTTDAGLLKAAQESGSRHIITYDKKKYISVALQNPLFGFWIVQLADYSKITANVLSNILFSAFIGAVIFVCVSVFLIITVNKITKPIKNLTLLMSSLDWEKKPEDTRITVYESCEEAMQLSSAFNQMFMQLHTYIDNLYQEQNARRLAELTVLQNQINPHFIYNTLTSIKYLAAAGKNQEVTEGITAFIQLLRKTMGDTRETITLREETELLKSYFRIQTLRYGSGIRLMLQIPPSCEKYSVPKLFLQPLVENSIFHGFSHTMPKGDISVYASELPDMLLLEILDNGQGIPEETLQKLLSKDSRESNPRRALTGIGIRNVNERIQMIYGKAYGLKISSIEGYGTQITIRLPKQENHKEDTDEGTFNKAFDY